MNKNKIKTLIISLSLIACSTFSAYAMERERIAGENRYKTSLAISAKWSEAKTVILATGENFPDALGSGILSKQNNAPIILTTGDELSQDLKSELNRLKTNKVILLGGEGVISSVIENELKLMNITTERLCGQDRYETAVQIANKVSNPEAIILVSGEDFGDALSLSPISAKHNYPILLGTYNSISQATKDYINAHKNTIKKIYVAGADRSDLVPEFARSIETCKDKLLYNDMEFPYNIKNEVVSELGIPYERITQTIKENSEFRKGVEAGFEKYKSLGILGILSSMNNSANKGFDFSNIESSHSHNIKNKIKTVEDIVLYTGEYASKTGISRQGKNIAALDTFKNDFNYDKVFIATESNFPDSLSAVALAVKETNPIIFLDTTQDNLDTRLYLENKKSSKEVILGGHSVVRDSQVNLLFNKIATTEYDGSESLYKKAESMGNFSEGTYTTPFTQNKYKALYHNYPNSDYALVDLSSKEIGFDECVLLDKGDLAIIQIEPNQESLDSIKSLIAKLFDESENGFDFKASNNLIGEINYTTRKVFPEINTMESASGMIKPMYGYIPVNGRIISFKAKCDCKNKKGISILITKKLKATYAVATLRNDIYNRVLGNVEEYEDISNNTGFIEDYSNYDLNSFTYDTEIMRDNSLKALEYTYRRFGFSNQGYILRDKESRRFSERSEFLK